jgi:hypothetical protein
MLGVEPRALCLLALYHLRFLNSKHPAKKACVTVEIHLSTNYYRLWVGEVTTNVTTLFSA